MEIPLRLHGYSMVAITCVSTEKPWNYRGFNHGFSMEIPLRLHGYPMVAITCVSTEKPWCLNHVDSMWAKTHGNSMDFLKTFSMEDFRKGQALSMCKFFC